MGIHLDLAGFEHPYCTRNRVIETLKGPTLMPIEMKTANGSREEGQLGAYSMAFRPPGSRYQFALAIRQTQMSLYLLSPTGWAVVRTEDYYERTKSVAELIAFVLCDEARDDTLGPMLRDGFQLLPTTDAFSIYDRDHMPPFLPTSSGIKFIADLHTGPRVPRPIFNSEMLWGARSQAWSLRGCLQDEDGRVLERGDFVVTCKLLRKDKAVNSHVFSSRLAAQAPLHQRAHWFEQSMGIHLDAVGFERPHCTRIRVIEVLKGPTLTTWDEGMQMDALSIPQVVDAYRACLIILWQMRPLHHRDVSIYNLLIDTSVPVSFAPMPLEIEQPSQMSGRLFDYGNSRWANEPSEAKRRPTRISSMSEDDAWTGTFCFLSRAALHLDQALEMSAPSQTAECRRHQPQHRHWHDAESLFLCVTVFLASRFYRSKVILNCVDAWLSSDLDNPEVSWLPQASRIRSLQQNVTPLNKREAHELVVAQDLLLHSIRALKKIADVEEMNREEVKEALFGASAEAEQLVFEELLQAANSAMYKLEHLATAPDVARLEGPALRVLRSRIVNERVATAERSSKEGSATAKSKRKREVSGTRSRKEPRLSPAKRM